MGYRSKSKIKDFPKLKNEVKKTHQHQHQFQVVTELDKNPEIEKPKETVKQNQLFEVFAPNSDKTISLDEKKSIAKKSHSPKTLIIKPKS
jgi:oligoribonuclease NrnB/cAMP/cGMP phosphodiesterase (DHH superfamily)